MIEVAIPGGETLILEHLVLDYNGTLAQDGLLLEGVWERLVHLTDHLRLHVVTADTFGLARSELSGLPVELVILPAGEQAQAKLTYIQQLDEAHVVVMGNGRNDAAMLQTAALGIAVLQGEGAAAAACLAADVLAPNILVALDLLRSPQRLVATLRA